MIKTENGFIYPVTLSVYLLVICFFLVITGIYINEKRIYNDSKLLLIQEYYFMSTVKQLEEELRADRHMLTGEFHYRTGEVAYTVEQVSDDVLKVEYRLFADKMEPMKAYSYFDRGENRMTKWVEVK
ncbi:MULTISPECIES: competence type IV pilus minor pilin ComGG [Bacillaceae]|uniref:competence type IV pilus minor pilin ComGG n=1 Tax=Bacillaceae TaxID=186817 RepID=UPI001E6107AA|nr:MULTISPECIES: competence type IV pilus minor pilin ComGG [Bacillaceae]MCE4047067.1 hypothetical protein [Bacillus sp. Au-Bac7]MCM3030171.1 ComGG family competence protein [Niallia sp. MER 6]MDL0437446.1 competence type IV pilus minor pilin ComGG [Niallia sp. SS-2023]UPO86553.1 ComGG family competence protein [Niallia sp. Man26]